MMRSLYSGVSGLRNHQTRMDVIGNNIANVNTVGFKASRTIFQDMYSQNMKAASSPGSTTGGTNPQQIGLGMTLSTIDTLFTRSAAQITGSTYDLMIENDGFFVVKNGTEEYYTRAGNFYEDKAHNLVTSSGFYLQGYKASIMEGASPKPSSPTAAAITSQGATNPITGVVSLDRGAQNNNRTYEIIVTDAAANKIQLIERDATTGDQKSVTAATLTVDPLNPTTVTVGSLTLTLDAAFDINDLHQAMITTDNTGVDASVLGSPDSFITTAMGNIYVDDNLKNVSIDKNGNVTALVKSDGYITDPATQTQIKVSADQKVTLGRVIVATFDNQQGLEKVGSNMYRSTSNTGSANYKNPGTDGAGQINPGALEMSNVDLAQEFTDMIVTQRGFQANSRIITVSDTLLEELINLKR